MVTSPRGPACSNETAIDAVLLASFGGPEGPDEVMPFLRGVTAGRPVPQERLAAVAKQYLHFGGVSPINAQNRVLQGRLRAELLELGLDLPVYFGNRNWHPFFVEVIPMMAAAGHREIAIVATSGFASQPGCWQYQQDVSAAIAAVGVGMGWRKTGLWFDHPMFLEIAADSVLDAFTEHDADLDQRGSKSLPVVLFSTHSLPTSVAAVSGPVTENSDSGGAYVAQHLAAAAAITELVSDRVLRPVTSELVFQSRSGAPGTAWLEPDINARLTELARAGVESVVVFPLGFATDHMEIMWDLDVRAKATATALGMRYRRARTVGTDPRFARMLAGMVVEQVAAPGTAASGSTPSGGVAGRCPLGCCVGIQPSDVGARTVTTGR